MSELKDQPTIRPTDKKITAQAQKAPYLSPMLQVYGSVGKLTQTGSRGGSDGASMMP